MPNWLKIFAFILCFNSIGAIAQLPEKFIQLEKSLDTLEHVDKVLAQCRLAFYYAFRDMPKAYDFAHASVSLAEEIDDDFARNNAYRNLGIVYDVDAKPDSCLMFFQKALKISEILGDDKQISMNINNLGMYHWNQGNLTSAIDFFIQSFTKDENRADDIAMGFSANNICLIYNELDQAAKASPYCERALKLRKEAKDTFRILESLNNFTIVQEGLGNLEEAKILANEGLAMSYLPGYENMRDEFHGALGSIYFKEENYKNALVELKKAISHLENGDDLNTLHKYYAKAAIIQNTLGNYTSAKAYTKKGLAITDSLGISFFNAALYESLSVASFELGDNKAGREALQLWTAAKDSTFSRDNAIAFAQKEVEYETQKKEQQILLQQSEIKKKTAENRTLFGASLATVLLLLLGFIAWRNRSQLNRQKEMQALEMKAKSDQFLAVLSAEEIERQRLARDLHDGLGQVLSTARMNVSALEEADLNPQDQGILQNSISLIDRAVTEMRDVSHDLMPRTLVNSNLIVALEEMTQKINSVNKSSVTFKHDIHEFLFSKDHQIVLYRIFQELFNNSLKHAPEADLALYLSETSNSYIFNLNQSLGIVDENKLKKSRGIGWSNIQARLALLNGKLNISPDKGGTQFLITLSKSNYESKSD